MQPHSFWRPLWLTRKVYLDIAISSVFLNILAICLPVFIRVVYDRIIPNFAQATLWVLFSGMLLVLVFEILFKLSRSYITDRLGHEASAKLEQEFHDHLLYQPQAPSIARSGQYFGYLQEIRDFYCQKLVPTLIDAPFVLSFLLVIFLICPVMVLVPIVMGVVIIGTQYAFHGALHKGMLVNQQAMYAKQNALVENLNGRQTIRQLACYTPFRKIWKSVSDEAAATQAKLSIWHGLVINLCQAAVVLNSILLIVVGVYEIQAGTLTVGGLLAISVLSSRALVPLTGIGAILAKWPQLRDEMHEIERVLDQPVEQPAETGEVSLQGALRVQQASVQYPEQTIPALREVTFGLAAGQKLALIGPSGAGKTTLLRALSAEVPLSAGAIRWDDRDQAHLSPVALRGQLGIVDQYPYFFARSLRENLLMGLKRSDDEIFHVLEIVGLAGFVKAMGRGLDFPVAEGGGNLSGGQRQALAIARALLRDAPVLLMDEPTSMMDHIMEQKLVQNLKTALEGKTLVIVTHRSPLLSLVDGVATLEGGRMTRFGQRDEILKELSNHVAR